MNDSTRPDPQPFSRGLSVAVMTTVLYGAVLVATYGIISVLADRDVVSEPDAGPLVGIAMTGTALVIMFFAMLGGLRPDRARGIPVARALVTGLGVYLLSTLAGALMYAIVTGRLPAFIVFLGNYLLSPFVISSGVIATLFILLLPVFRLVNSRAR